jgi:hypothetical protein
MANIAKKLWKKVKKENPFGKIAKAVKGGDSKPKKRVTRVTMPRPKARAKGSARAQGRTGVQ